MTVYQYIFTYEGQNSLTKLFGIQEPIGVCHADELFYMWKLFGMNTTLNEADTAVMKTMVSTWVNFATKGNPSLSWTPIGPGGAHQHIYWNISTSTPNMVHSEDIKARMEFWDSVMMNGGQSNQSFSLYLPLIMLVLLPLENFVFLLNL